MKTVLLFAIILPGIAAAAPNSASQSSSAAYGTVRSHYNRSVAFRRTHSSAPPVVAAAPSGAVAETPTRLEGLGPRFADVDQPIQMLNPLAPPQYGSARDLVVYTEHDNVNSNENASRLQPEGIRLLTIRPIW